MPTKCFKPIFGKKIRVSKMDQSCRPVITGECSEVVTDGFASLTLSSETEDGVTITTRKANGAICINYKGPDSFLRFTLEMEFCGVDPDLLSFMTNMNAYADWAGDIAGVTVYEGAVDKKFGLEIWTGIDGTVTDPDVEEASGYVLLACVNAGVIGDITVDGENAVTFSMSGAYTVSGNAWGVGNHRVLMNPDGDGVGEPWPDFLPEALLPTEPMLIMETGVAPPPSACGCVAYAADPAPTP
jgi:hypothetical protein